MNKKSLFRVLVALVLVFSLVLTPVSQVFATEVEPTSNEVVLVHTNDIHGRINRDDEDGLIGYALMKTYIDQLRAENQVILLDAGDATHGTNEVNLSKGSASIKLMNLLGYDAISPGNHEFNYGYDQLVANSKEANFPFLAANVVKEDGTRDFASSTKITVGDKVIGIFGLATPETKTKSHPNNTAGIVFEDVKEAAQREIDKLKAEGADFIVFLSHLGVDASSEINTYTVVDNTTGIDLVIDGHSHSTMEAVDRNGVKISQAWEYGKRLGVTRISFSDAEPTITTELKSLEDLKDLTPDADVEALISSIEEENGQILNVVIGNTAVELNGLRENVRTGETNLSNLITDAMLAESEADMVLTNGGGIRASIGTGEITMGEALEVLPFGNLMTVIKVSGQDIIDALTFGTRDYPNASGGFPQVAGATYTIVYGGPDGNYIEDLMIGGQPVDPAKEYTLATNDFTAVGGDGYTMFEGKEQVALHGALVDVLANYIKELSQDGPFTYKKDGRIIAKEYVEEELVVEVSGYPHAKLAVRPAPGSSELLGYIDINELVEGTLEGAWIKFEYNGKEAYVAAKFIHEEKLLTGLYPHAKLAVRPAPGSSELLGLLNINQEVKGTLEGSWVKTTFNGKEAYVAYKFLKDYQLEQTGYLRATIVVREKIGGKIIGSIDKGTLIKDALISPINNNWLEIQYNGQKAYIARSYVVGYEISQSRVFVTNGYIRVSASSSAEKAGIIKKGTRVQATDLGAWIKFQHNGKTVYAAKFLTEVVK